VFGWSSKKDAKNAEQLITQGMRAEKAGDLALACDRYRKAVAIAPRLVKARLNLGVGLEAAGDISGAMASYEAALAIEPANAAANYNLGRLLYTRGEFDRAERLLGEALAAQPDFAQARTVYGYVLRELADIALARAAQCYREGRLPEAEAACRSVLARDGQNGNALHLLGLVRWAEGRHADAIELYRRSVGAQPDHAGAVEDLANALLALGRAGEALECYRKVLVLAPASASAHYNVGIAERELGNGDAAIASFRRAIELEPSLAPAHYALGHALREAARVDEALAAFRRAVALKPDYAEARWCFVMAQLPTVYGVDDDPAACRNRFAAELAQLEKWFTEHPGHADFAAVGSHQPFALAYHEQDNRALLGRYGALCSRLMSDSRREQRLPIPGPRRHQPIRVGIVSSYFRNHSVWNAPAKGWFRALDRERFALYAFDLGAGEDAETRLAKSHATRFEAGPRDFGQWVDAIRACEPDVLIYPEVGMHPMTARLAALRLAPVQAASWGHPETTGLPTMDYYLSGEALEPPDAQAYYTEQLVALPQFGCLLERPDVVPEYPEFARFGVDPDVPLLLSPGMAFKYAPKHDWVFAEIARRLGQCQFLFFRHWNPALTARLAERLAAAFKARQLDYEGYVRFLPWQTQPQFHGWLRRADVYLDTIGFSGFNTALQGVECGLPIVTREGRFMRGRLASAILKRIGLAELVVPTEEAYVELAVRLVQDADYSEAVASRMERERHGLYEDSSSVRALEALLAQAR
jgi:predicted O-linked N-acetylglucosamine transferase (SPINDLY family)